MPGQNRGGRPHSKQKTNMSAAERVVGAIGKPLLASAEAKHSCAEGVLRLRARQMEHCTTARRNSVFGAFCEIALRHFQVCKQL